MKRNFLNNRGLNEREQIVIKDTKMKIYGVDKEFNESLFFRSMKNGKTWDDDDVLLFF